MSTQQIIILAFAGIGLFGALAIISVAWRRSPDEAVTGRTDRRALRRDRKAEKARIRAVEPVQEEAEEPVLVPAGPPPVDPLEAREAVDEETYGVTRRQFFNRGVLGVFGLFLAQFGIASLAFMWPRLQSGGFGSRVNAGKVSDLRLAATAPDGRPQPVFISAAQAYVVPFTGTAEGSSFEGLPVIAGDLMALWQRCVHLGCRVPECASSLGFECPCHGSKYNLHGEYEDGPAPRNLDRFIVAIDESDNLIIDTGNVIETSRSSVKTIEYPQGPSCI